MINNKNNKITKESMYVIFFIFFNVLLCADELSAELTVKKQLEQIKEKFKNEESSFQRIGSQGVDEIVADIKSVLIEENKDNLIERFLKKERVFKHFNKFYFIYNEKLHFNFWGTGCGSESHRFGQYSLESLQSYLVLWMLERLDHESKVKEQLEEIKAKFESEKDKFKEISTSDSDKILEDIKFVLNTKEKKAIIEKFTENGFDGSPNFRLNKQIKFTYGSQMSEGFYLIEDSIISEGFSTRVDKDDNHRRLNFCSPESLQSYFLLFMLRRLGDELEVKNELEKIKAIFDGKKNKFQEISTVDLDKILEDIEFVLSAKEKDTAIEKIRQSCSDEDIKKFKATIKLISNYNPTNIYRWVAIDGGCLEKLSMKSLQSIFFHSCLKNSRMNY